ncbi:hypothetical protein AVEN_153361-1 [Araneus ventricosus]|uniref:Uncharacterized protein n=1 Tax=Araneus ventricosus TaxID=182803 RepID=A0A4Y1ZQA0_ARAVE|nr:hypothetical protein AVEN_153361-1 [Araneus ventricosus]
MLVLGIDFYRGMYGNAREMKPLILNLGDHFGDFVDKMSDLKNTRIFSICLLGAGIRISPNDSMRRLGQSRRLYISVLGSREVELIDCDRLWRANAFVESVLRRVLRSASW